MRFISFSLVCCKNEKKWLQVYFACTLSNLLPKSALKTRISIAIQPRIVFQHKSTKRWSLWSLKSFWGGGSKAKLSDDKQNFKTCCSNSSTWKRRRSSQTLEMADGDVIGGQPWWAVSCVTKRPTCVCLSPECFPCPPKSRYRPKCMHVQWSRASTYSLHIHNVQKNMIECCAASRLNVSMSAAHQQMT